MTKKPLHNPTPQPKSRSSSSLQKFRKVEKVAGVLSLLLGLAGLFFFTQDDGATASPSEVTVQLAEALAQPRAEETTPWRADVIATDDAGLRVLTGQTWRWVEYAPGLFQPDPANSYAVAVAGEPVAQRHIAMAQDVLANTRAAASEDGLWCLLVRPDIRSQRVVCEERRDVQ